VSDADDEGSLASIAGGAVTLLTLTVAFGLLALGVEAFWIAFPVGFGGLLPLSVALARRYESETDDDAARESTGEDALDALRAEYARGEIGEAEFERRLERLLETERPADRPPRPPRTGAADDRGDERATERE